MAPGMMTKDKRYACVEIPIAKACPGMACAATIAAWAQIRWDAAPNPHATLVVPEWPCTAVISKLCFLSLEAAASPCETGILICRST